MPSFVKEIALAGVLFTLFWCCNRIFTVSNELPTAKVIHSFGLYVFIVAILSCWFYFTPYEKISLKVLVLFLLITGVFATIMYTGVQAYLIINYTWEEIERRYRQDPNIAVEKILPGTKFILDMYQPFLFAVMCTIHYRFKKIDIHKSEMLNDDDIFIVFVYPKNLTGLFLTTFWRYPVSTIKLYHKGFIYGFKRPEERFVKRRLSKQEAYSGDYFFKNTFLREAGGLKALMDTDWTLRKNCLNVFEPIIGKLKGYI